MQVKITGNQFSAALEENRLLGLRCSCGAYNTPPTIACRECGDGALDVVEMAGKGNVVTYTLIQTAPEGFEAPYVVAVVALAEGPWVMGNIIGLDLAEANEALFGKNVSLSHLVWPGDRFSAGRKIVMAFTVD